MIREGIAEPDEVPLECGVLVAREAGDALDAVRPAPRRPLKLPFHAWMALARATPMEGWQHDESQGRL